MRAPGLGVAAVVVAVLVVLEADEASAKPTIYVKNDNDKLEPVLVPVSSTVIPLPVYKVGFSLGTAKGPKGDGERSLDRPGEPIKLITVHHKKKAISATTKEKHTTGGSSA